MDNAKDYKRDLDVLTVNMRTAEGIREKIELAQEKLREATEEGQEAEEKIAQAEVTLKELQQLQEEVRKLHTQLQRRQEDVVVKEQSVRSAYGKIENIMNDSDEELQGFLNDYDGIIEDHRRAFGALKAQEARLQVEQNKSKEDYVALRASKARVETNIATYQKMVADLIDLAAKLGTKYRFHLQPLSSQQDDISAFVAEFRNVVKDKQEEVNSLDAKQRQEDDKLTTELSELTSRVKQLRDELNSKTRSLETLNQEKRALTSRLRELGGAGVHSQREADEMSSQVTEAEKSLEDYKQKNDVMALKSEIQGYNRQINDINDVIDALGQQIGQLRLYASKNSEIEFKRNDYLKKHEAFQATLSEKVADFEEILEGGDKPTDRDSLASAVGRIDSLIVERKRSCDTKRMELAAAEKRLMENTTSSKLAEKELDSLRQKKNELERQHMTGLKALLEKVIPGEDLRNAELGVKEAEQAYADAKDKVVRRKNMVMFLNIYKKKGIKDHCCPLCERDMTPEEEQAFEAILSDKTDDGKVADKIKKAEELERSTLETLTGIKQQMPSWRKWLELETTIPQKVNELQEIYAAQKALENGVLDKKTALELIQEKFEDAKVAKTELDSLRKTADELHMSDMTITREERMKASQGMGGRSLADVEAEKDAKQAELQELNRQVQRKQRELDHTNEILQQLQNDLHNRREEKLRMETQRKEYDDAIKEQNRLRDQEKTLKDACSKLKSRSPS